MSAIRQQRARQSRRAKPLATNPTPQIILWQFDSTTTVYLRLLLPLPPASYVLAGIPQIRAVTTDQLPTLAQLFTNGDPDWPAHVDMSYAVSLPNNETFVIPPYDPALRNNTGGYLAPGTIATTAPPPTAFPYTASSDLSSGADVICGGSVGSVTMLVGAQFMLNGSHAGGVVTRTTETGFHVEFGVATAPGDDLVWTPVNGTVYGDNGAKPAGGAVTLG